MIADTDLVILGMFLFIWIFVFILGFMYHPAFHFLAGLIGLFFAFELESLLANTILTTMVVAINIVILVMGLVERF